MKRPEQDDVVQIQSGWAKGQRGVVIDVEDLTVTVRLGGDFPSVNSFDVREVFVLPEGMPERRDVE